ncbi:MAG: polysaccharide deacetylase family protein [Candidatus Zixiibacteriota bacterium]|nr:MAG: polysaccharide deacetylase family protein [candidate division Zixibacteria bacterium]
MMSNPTGRSIIKYFLAVLLFYSGVLAAYRFFKTRILGRPDLSILMYHRVLDNPWASAVLTQPGMAVSTEVFDRQMAYLSKSRQVIRLTALAEAGRSLPRGAVAVTFDDGWRDNFTNAYPVLQKHEIPATIFLTADFVGTPKSFWFLSVSRLLREGNFTGADLSDIVRKATGIQSGSDTRPAADHTGVTGSVDADPFIESLKDLDPETLERVIAAMRERSPAAADAGDDDKPMLSWEEVIEMQSGGVEFGSHGCSHRILTRLPGAQAQDEITGSRIIIEERLGRKTDCFSYPNGDYNAQVKAAVEQAGYLCAVTTRGDRLAAKSTDRFSLRRIAVHEGISVGPRGRFSKAMFVWHLARNL